MYLSKNEVYRGGREIMVRTPVVNIRTTSNVLNYARVGGKVHAVGAALTAGYQIYGDIDKGNYYSAGARAAGFALLPVFGWGVTAGIGVIDYVGEKSSIII